MQDAKEASYTRNEPAARRHDRNYSELLQETRVVQTGVQILFAFLLAIAFQQRFAGVDRWERALFLAALFCAACASVLLTAPAAVHRVLFARNVKDEIVVVTARLLTAGLAFLALAMLTAVAFVVSFVVGIGPALLLAGTLGCLVLLTWVVLPHRRRPGPVDLDEDLPTSLL